MQQSAARAVADAWAHRTGHAVIGGTLLRQLSRLGRQLAAARCPAATRSSNGSARESTESSKKELAGAEKTTATSPPMVAGMAAELPVLSCSETNMEER